MKIVVAIDSLKGSLTSIEAGNAIKQGILNIDHTAQVIIKPLADGGEGTAQALVSGMGGSMQTLEVTGPLKERVNARYGMLEGHETAIIEMAEAAGLPLVPMNDRNPLYTTTYGVGEIIRKCIEEGCRKFIVGIGGSATNDAGIGMLMALGFKFIDINGQEVGQGGQGLEQIVGIDTSKVLPELRECEFKIACDVDNPLYGENGAAAIYGPQKGATPEMVERLDQGLRNFAEVVKTFKQQDFSQVPGAGAAGGLGFGFMAFLNGKLESGIQIILKEIKLEEDLKDADLVITGEGRLDNQTAMGKAPIGVAKLAKKYNLPVLGFAGALANEAKKCNEEGIDAYFSIVNAAMSLEDAMNPENAKQNMTKTVEQVFNLIKLYK
ncbi:glycerate kinase [Niameybacter massiliensis]|uniref:Glycerate kinase n=1 Tax=Holtiella tumoricola TaxID=3018743 RepID=A0AA42J138_9FIRM|nr:glycerate kinase [Holtiella tumoricola]